MNQLGLKLFSKHCLKITYKIQKAFHIFNFSERKLLFLKHKMTPFVNVFLANDSSCVYFFLSSKSVKIKTVKTETVLKQGSNLCPCTISVIKEQLNKTKHILRERVSKTLFLISSLKAQNLFNDNNNNNLLQCQVFVGKGNSFVRNKGETMARSFLRESRIFLILKPLVRKKY